ncbi:LacI family DNA-binding transcriptional regulator [Paenibacillus durus]|uniref:LacI family transcriptional regulator n=3 Tax=Paenibacillus durus TaxID=44251 RepID=A0A0F7FEZ8_PAEDU|nr:LacI family DNA-binding transcriptional regulator [Paenibacillus durus]AKG37253.1 LacI family transcriptional regulator [Paenibacillus durus ATCC 35681]
MKPKTTIRDVAEFAGVSTATVSYVLNDINKVSQQTKERVLEAIKHLDYHPDFTAISLSKRKSNMIGVMIPFVNHSLAPIFKQDHYYMEIISGMEHISSAQNYDLLISGVRDTEDCKSWVAKRNLDGLIISGPLPDSLMKELNTFNIPIVLIDNYGDFRKNYQIMIDDELGGYLGTKHLLNNGHTHISFVRINLPSTDLIDQQRYRGFKRALNEAHISINPDLVFDANGNSFEIGYKIGMKILDLKEKTTAIFASTDILAVGIIQAFRENGKEVPKDYSIVGFDDLEISRYISPKLTTIRQDVFNKGVVSAQTIIDAIEQNGSHPVKLTLPIELIVRESTRSI